MPAAMAATAAFGAMLWRWGKSGSRAEKSKCQLASTSAPATQTTRAQRRATPSATLTARGTGNAILTGTSITRLPHPQYRGVEARAKLGAPRQKAPKNQQQ